MLRSRTRTQHLQVPATIVRLRGPANQSVLPVAHTCLCLQGPGEECWLGSFVVRWGKSCGDALLLQMIKKDIKKKKKKRKSLLLLSRSTRSYWDNWDLEELGSHTFASASWPREHHPWWCREVPHKGEDVFFQYGCHVRQMFWLSVVSSVLFTATQIITVDGTFNCNSHPLQPLCRTLSYPGLSPPLRFSPNNFQTTFNDSFTSHDYIRNTRHTNFYPYFQSSATHSWIKEQRLFILRDHWKTENTWQVIGKLAK